MDSVIRQPCPLDKRRDTSDSLALYLIGFVALLVRLAPLLRHGEAWAVLDDSHQFISVARGFLAGCGFARFDGVCQAPELFRASGYPFLLAIMPGLRETILLQAVISAGVCVALGIFTCRNWGIAAAVVAEATIALDVPSIVTSATIMSDSLFQSLLTLVLLLQLMVLMSESFDQKEILFTIAGAILLGLACMIRAVGIVLIPLLVIPVLLAPRCSSFRRISVSLFALVIPSAFVLAWTVRNGLLTGIWTFSTEGVATFYYYMIPAVSWYRTGETLTASQTQLAHAAGYLTPSEVFSSQAYSHMVRESFALVCTHPFYVTFLTIRFLAWLIIVPDRANLNALLGTNARSSKFLVASGDIALRIRDLRHSALLTAVVGAQLLLTALLWVGVVGSLFEMKLSKDRMRLILYSFLIAMFILTLSASVAASAVIARMRDPILPILAMLSGIGWSQIYLRLRKTKKATGSIDPNREAHKSAMT